MYVLGLLVCALRMQLPPHFLYKKKIKQTKLKRKQFGSISGLTEKLDYIQDLGVESIWLSPIYEFGGVDYGNDIIDHKKIDPLFGTEDDFEALLREVDKRGELQLWLQSKSLYRSRAGRCLQ